MSGLYTRESLAPLRAAGCIVSSSVRYKYAGCRDVPPAPAGSSRGRAGRVVGSRSPAGLQKLCWVVSPVRPFMAAFQLLATLGQLLCGDPGARAAAPGEGRGKRKDSARARVPMASHHLRAGEPETKGNSCICVVFKYAKWRETLLA